MLDLAESIAANWSTRSSITSRDAGDDCPGSEGFIEGEDTLVIRVGTRVLPEGSKPGAMRRNASRWRRNFSSSRARKYAALRD